MEAPEPIVIRDGACQYRIIKPIGNWGPKFNIPVYEAVILPETNNLPHVALKMVSRNDENIYLAIEEVIRITTSFKFLPHSILPIKKQFHAPFNKVLHHCTVLLFDAQVTSVRSLMLSRSMFAGGIPPSCIAAVLLRTLVGLSEVHSIRSTHDQITAGTIFYHHNDGTIKLAFAASVYERTTVTDPGPVQPIQFPAAAHDQEASSSSNPNPNPNPDQNQIAPINHMLDWARAPEVVQIGDRGLESYTHTSRKSDIWLIGIVALELAYGKIQVANREEMLSIAGFIGNSLILPNTWEDLRRVAAGGEIREDSVSRFSATFGDFVGKCLATDRRKRATTNFLWNHDFLRTSESMAFFENVVVKGLSPPVARAASQRRRSYRQLPGRRRSNLGGGN